MTPPGGGDSCANPGHQGTYMLADVAGAWSVGRERRDEGRLGQIMIGPLPMLISSLEPSEKAKHVSQGGCPKWPPSLGREQ